MAKELRSMEIEPAENGGHTVTHRFKDAVREGKHGMMTRYVEPESHVFGPEEGDKMMDHVAEHLGIDRGEEKAIDDEPKLNSKVAEKLRG